MLGPENQTRPLQHAKPGEESATFRGSTSNLCLTVSFTLGERTYRAILDTISKRVAVVVAGILDEVLVEVVD